MFLGSVPATFDLTRFDFFRVCLPSSYVKPLYFAEGCLGYLTELFAELQEAHVFSTTDGMAAEVFVVEGWLGEEVNSFLHCHNMSRGLNYRSIIVELLLVLVG